MIHTYKDLIVWQKSVELVREVYELTEKFPSEEKFVFTIQMRKCALSISSNIAEGKLRNSPKEFKQFLYIAYASAGELETQMLIAKQLPRLKIFHYEKNLTLLEEIMKMLNKLLRLPASNA